MKRMKKYVILMISLMIIGCSKDNQNENINAFNLDVGVEFSVINSDGEDILNPNNPNAINKSDIKLFYLIDGVKKEVYNSNYDYPRNFKIYEHQNEYRITIWQNNTDSEEKPLTFVQWSKDENDIDKIETIYERTSNAVLQRKIWLNDDLLWESNSGIEPFFVLTK